MAEDRATYGPDVTLSPRGPDAWLVVRAAFGAFVLMLCLASAACSAAEELTEDTLMELEMDIVDAEPADAAKMLTPYLAKPDPRLASLIADVLIRGETVPLDVRDSLFDALMKIAGEETFEPAVKILQSEDIELVRKAIYLVAKTRHRQAAAALVKLYKSTSRIEVRKDALIALGELNDRSALTFVSQVARTAKVEELRNEALIAGVRLGATDGLTEIVSLYARLSKDVYEIVIRLSWQRQAEPRTYRQRMRDMNVMKAQVGRIETAIRTAAREHAETLLRHLMAATEPEEVEVYYPHIGAILDAVPAQQGSKLAEHVSSVIALRAMRLLADRGPAGASAATTAIERLARSVDPRLRERAMRLVKLLPAEKREAIVSAGLADRTYRCRQAAVRAALYIRGENRNRLLTPYAKREPYIRLRDGALWLLRYPGARTSMP